MALGLLGSFHCVGMCGPLALSLPINSNSSLAKFFGALLYNCGRVVTYSFFGLIFGIIGRSVALFGFQQWLSVIAGVLIILLVIMPKNIFASAGKPGIITRFFVQLRASIGQLFSKRNRSTLFAIG